jgi:hypothetical protein
MKREFLRAIVALTSAAAFATACAAKMDGDGDELRGETAQADTLSCSSATPAVEGTYAQLRADGIVSSGTEYTTSTCGAFVEQWDEMPSSSTPRVYAFYVAAGGTVGNEVDCENTHVDATVYGYEAPSKLSGGRGSWSVIATSASTATWGDGSSCNTTFYVEFDDPAQLTMYASIKIAAEAYRTSNVLIGNLTRTFETPLPIYLSLTPLH